MNSQRLNDAIDLAGYCSKNPTYFRTRARINRGIDRYLSIDILSDRLADLPSQFTQPRQRPWEPICWQAIDREQIVGVDPALFISIVAASAEVEAPVRQYALESRDYLQSIHPQMAFFMGGEPNPDGSVKILGIWEKEERQHAPTFSKIYQQLTGEKLQPKPNSVVGYQPTDNPWEALYRHTLSRISTEWGATSIYLWLMAHSTGALQQAIAQPLQDEVNHLAKFWGFSRWAFAESYFQQLKGSSCNLMGLLEHHQHERSQGTELLNKNRSLEELSHTVELTFALMRVMVRLRSWNQELSYSFLKHLFGPSPKIVN